jgi:hypothetical protein
MVVISYSSASSTCSIEKTYFLSIGGIGVRSLPPSPNFNEERNNLFSVSVSVSFPLNPTNRFSSSSASLYSIALLALVLAPYPYPDPEGTPISTCTLPLPLPAGYTPSLNVLPLNGAKLLGTALNDFLFSLDVLGDCGRGGGEGEDEERETDRGLGLT